MGSQQQASPVTGADDDALSGAAELAIAALLLRGVALAPALARRKGRYLVEPTEEERRAWRSNAGIAKEIWDKKYASPVEKSKTVVRTVTDPDGNTFEIEDPDEFESPAKAQSPAIRIRIPADRVDSAERFRNFFRRTNDGPEVAVQIRADPAILAHEMGHAEMYARGNQLNGAASDLVSRLQEGKLSWIPNPRSLAAGRGSWQDALLPAAGALAGLGAGALLGDSGSAIGGLVGLSTGVPLFVVEAEAWRRGAEYAKAMGVGRRRYAAQALLPLASYAALPLSSAALGAASAELSNDLFHGKLG